MLNTAPVRSHWREFEFLLMAVQSAIIPRLSIKGVLSNWHKIKCMLMENKRHRRLQLDMLYESI